MLKQTTNKHRALFLQLFTREIILHLQKEEKEKVLYELGEKIERKEEEKEKITKPIEIKKHTIHGIPSVLSLNAYHPVHPTKEIRQFTAPIKPKRLVMEIPPQLPLFKPNFQPSLPKVPAPPSYAERGTGVSIAGDWDLGKLNQFLADRELTMIECPGPGKFIFVRKVGRVNLTKISLSQEEIDRVIERFSEKAKIPVIGGVFKASVDDLTISAVISDFVGSRFIISKSSPYSLIEQHAQQLAHAQAQHNPLMQKRLQKFSKTF